MATKKYKDIEYYLDLPWTYTIEKDQEKGKPVYVVYVNELPGVCTDAPTFEEAMELIKEPMILALEAYMEYGKEIPEPIDENKFKGNIAYRTTGRRHYLLMKEAQRRRESLSELIDELIDTALLQNNSRKR